MPGFSDYLENKILNYIRGTDMGTAPPAVYVGLFNADPTDAGTGGTEVTTTVRAAGRVAATFGAPAAGTGNARQIANSAIVDFGNAAGAATVSHFGIFDAATAGNLLAAGAVTGGAQSIATGNGVSFAVGALTLSVD